MKQPESILKDSDGAIGTALHIAAKNGHLEIVRIIIEELPQLLNWKDELGRTAFLVAIIYGHASIVAFFLQRTTSGHLNERTLLQSRDNFGTNGLHFTIKFDHEAIFDILLVSHFYSLREPDGKGYTPLQLARYYGRDSMVKKIKNALPEHRNKKKSTKKANSNWNNFFQIN